MLAIMKRILDLAGGFSASSRRSLVAGMACNVLKAFFMAGMLAAVWWALENRDRLGVEVALQCFGMLALSVAGQFAFQYLVDIKMDAEGFHVFRDLRLRVGDRLKGAPMGYFSEQRLSAITTTLTTTVHQLEEFMTICLTGLSGGVAMAVIMIGRVRVIDHAARAARGRLHVRGDRGWARRPRMAPAAVDFGHARGHGRPGGHDRRGDRVRPRDGGAAHVRLVR